MNKIDISKPQLNTQKHEDHAKLFNIAIHPVDDSLQMTSFFHLLQAA